MSAAVGLCLLLAVHGAAAQPCRDDRLSVANGITFRTVTGLRYQAYPGQGWKTTVWAPLDRLRICLLGGNSYAVTDLDHRNDTIKALYLN